MQPITLAMMHGLIADRFDDYAFTNGLKQFDRLSFLMDLDAVAAEYPNFRWQDLLDADWANFHHDVGGITANMNRKTGLLGNCFVPRFSGELPDSQDEQADDLKEMMIADVRRANELFSVIELVTVSYKADTFRPLAEFVSVLLSDRHDEDITITQLGF